MSVATLRVEASRQRLRLAMSPPPQSSVHRRAARTGTLEALWLRWRSLPLVRDVVDSVASWWASHPLRPMGRVAGEASGAVVRPIAQRHPWWLMLGAAVIGAGLARARPWRWIFRSALFAGLAPQLAARVAANLPLESWLTMLVASSSSPRARASAAAAATPSDAGADPLAS
ncbi:MAG TPA: hypothetical protein VNU71_00170 [Burkholderiaceae bacterium]|nr:hypothetical protein [Burkholderiaceae bacterium]